MSEAQVQNLGVVLLREIENGLGVRHAWLRLLQSVALCRIEECKTGGGRRQFDCFYGSDNSNLY